MSLLVSRMIGSKNEFNHSQNSKNEFNHSRNSKNEFGHWVKFSPFGSGVGHNLVMSSDVGSIRSARDGRPTSEREHSSEF